MKINTLARLAIVAFLAAVLAGCAPQATNIPASDDRLHTQAGERGQAEIKATGKAGFLVFGPYIPLEPGTYRLVVKGSLKGAANPIATVDVVSEAGKRVWAVRPVYDSAATDVITAVAFVIDRPVVDAEFRILLAEQTVGTFKGFDLRKIE